MQEDGLTALGLKNQNDGDISGKEKNLTISLTVSIQYMSVTDRQTDGRIDTGRQLVPRLRIASHGKNFNAVNKTKC